MVRNIAKTVFSAGAHWLGIDGFAGAMNGAGRMPLIACYHRVVEDFNKSASHSISPMLICRDTFEKHLDWISSHYDIVSLDTLASKIMQGDPESGSLAAITFDDGYADVYANAFPLLSSRGLPATIFIVSDLTDTSRLQTHDELYLLISGVLEQWEAPGEKLSTFLNVAGLRHNKGLLLKCAHDPFLLTRLFFENFCRQQIDALLELLRGRIIVDKEILAEFHSLNWEKLREMEAANITIGSHTRSHPLLTNENAEVIKEEVEGSLQLFKEKLQNPVRHFAYPNGSFCKQAVEAVSAAGYDFAYTTCRHIDPDYPQLTIPRRVFWEHSSMDFLSRFSPAMMSCQVNGIFDPANLCKENHFS